MPSQASPVCHLKQVQCAPSSESSVPPQASPVLPQASPVCPPQASPVCHLKRVHCVPVGCSVVGWQVDGDGHEDVFQLGIGREAKVGRLSPADVGEAVGPLLSRSVWSQLEQTQSHNMNTNNKPLQSNTTAWPAIRSEM